MQQFSRVETFHVFVIYIVFGYAARVFCCCTLIGTCVVGFNEVTIWREEKQNPISPVHGAEESHHVKYFRRREIPGVLRPKR